MNELVVKNICKTINGKDVLKNVSFSVNRGEVIGFIGPNGAGKSSLFKVISGLIKPSSGEVTLENSSLHLNFNRLASKVGIFIEEPPLYPYLTGRENLKVKLSFHGMKMEEKHNQLFEKVGVESFIDKKVNEYSLGMKQRLGITSAIAHDPQYVILDEPTNTLDIHGIKLVRDLIIYLKGLKKTVIVSSHMLSEIEEVCDKILVIENGEIVDNNVLNNSTFKAQENLYFITIPYIEEFLSSHASNIYKVEDNQIILSIKKSELNSVIKNLIIENITIIDIVKNRKLEDYMVKKAANFHD